MSDLAVQPVSSSLPPPEAVDQQTTAHARAIAEAATRPRGTTAVPPGSAPRFDVHAARQAGYSDDEILQHLTGSRKFDVAAALKAGYSKPEIIDHLSAAPAAGGRGTPEQQAQLAKNDQIIAARQQTPDPGFWQVAGDMLKNGPKAFMDAIVSAHSPLEAWDAKLNANAHDAQKLREEGRPGEAVARLVSGLIPGSGDEAVAAGEEFGAGHPGAGAAHTAAALLPFAVPSAAKYAPRAVDAAADFAGETAGRVRVGARGFGEGAGESLKNAPVSALGKKVGRGVGYVAGRQLGAGFEGGLAGGYVGGEIGSRAAAVPEAVRAGVARAKARLRQAAQPPRPPAAWQAPVAEPPVPPAPAGEPVAPYKAQRNLAPVPPAPPPRPQPAWMRPVAEPPAEPPAAPPAVSRTLPSGRKIPTPEDISAKIDAAVKRATAPPEELRTATPAEDAQILDGIARSQTGKPFAKLAPADQATVRGIAQRLAQPAPAEAPPAVQPAPAVPAVAPSPAAAPPAAAPPVAEQSAPALESPRSQYDAAGNRKSPQLRAAEIQNMHRQAKAGRFADAMQKGGVKVSDALRMDDGHWKMLADGLGEKTPSEETQAEIVRALRKLQPAAGGEPAPAPKPAGRASTLAQQLEDSIAARKEKRP